MRRRGGQPHESGAAVPAFELRRHLPHLLRRAHFESEALFVSVYGNDVTSRQLALLTAVAGRPHASQSEIARDVGLDLNTCSDIVVRSVAKGLLRRERGAADARTFALDLTEAGREVVVAGERAAAAYADKVAAKLNGVERADLVDLLRVLLGFA